MAQSNQYRTVGDADIADEDPFAELTRIMGFDPRTPVTPEADPAGDFDLDLERELLGGVEPQGDPSSGHAASSPRREADETPAPDEPALSLEDERAIEEAFDDFLLPEDGLVLPEERDDAPYAAQAEEEPAAYGPADDFGFDAAISDDLASADWEATAVGALEPEADAEPFAEAEPDVPGDRAPAEATAEDVFEDWQDFDVDADGPKDHAEESGPFALDSLETEAASDGAAEPDLPEWMPAASRPETEPAAAFPAEGPEAEDADFLASLAELRDMEPGTAAEATSAASPVGESWTGVPAEESWSEAPAAEDSGDEAFADDEIEHRSDYRMEEEAEPESAPARAPWFAPAPEEEHPTHDISDLEPAEMNALDDRAFDAAIENELAAEPTAFGADRRDAQAEDAFASLTALGDPEESWAGDAESEEAWQEPSRDWIARSPSFAGEDLPAGSDVPDIETHDVAEPRLLQADPLDIPDIDFGEDAPPPAPYDDIDADFADAFAVLGQAEPVRAGRDQADVDPGSSGWEGDAEPDYGYVYPAAAAGAAMAAADGRERYAAPEEALEFDYQDDIEQSMGMEGFEEARRDASPRRRGLLIAMAVAGVALVGGIGAFALSGGSQGSGEPALVRADTDPVRVRPENPGGTVVPNQDNPVYERVASSGASALPVQERLISSAEEPIAIVAETAAPAAAPVAEEPEAGTPAEAAEAATMAVPGDDRLEQIMAEAAGVQAAETIAVTPRVVRTMVVRPDGTMVPREDPAPAAEPAATISAPPMLAPALAPVPAAGVDTIAPAVPSEPEASVSPPAAQPEVRSTGTTPAAGPVAPVRPADQPLEIVGTTAGATQDTQVAALSPAQPAVLDASPGGWSVQIASQPSAEGAQATYQDLARRYGGIIGGRGVNIVRAEIPDRGTYYRVRIPTASRAEANTLCTNLKSAGGNCFVSQ